MFFGGAPNIFSYLALALWLPIGAIIFRYLRPVDALITVIVGGILLLPERLELFDPPILPPLGKSFIISLSATIGALLNTKARRMFVLVWREVLLFSSLIGLSTILTIFTNTEALRFGPTTLPAMQFNEVLALTIPDIFFLVIPFCLAKAIIRQPGDALRFSILIVGAALLYSLPILVEIRMSPQVHRWLYGFAQHDFAMVLRHGGWRPMVCMLHGLSLSIFIVGALFICCTLAKTKTKIFSVSCRVWTVFLFVILIACKSTGAVIYGVVLLPLVIISKGRLLIWLGAFFSLFLLLYPLSRTFSLVDTEALISFTTEYDVDRAESLAFRFDNEAELLDRAYEKPIFGWSGHGRNLIWNSQGENVSVPDGSWIIVLGSRGYFGFFIIFGLLVYPVFLVFWRRKPILASIEGQLIATLCLFVGVRALELIPNSYFSFIPFFLSGSLAGLNASKSCIAGELGQTSADQVPAAAMKKIRRGQGIIISPVKKGRRVDGDLGNTDDKKLHVYVKKGKIPKD